MSNEEIQVTLARIEERLHALHVKMDVHDTVTYRNAGLIESNTRDIQILKRDRWWLFTLFGAALALSEAFLHRG